MVADFQFMGFRPSETLREKANRALDRLLDMAPYGSIAVALLEKDDLSYCCAIELYSKHGPFTARGYDKCPEAALEGVVRSLSSKLNHWKAERNLWSNHLTQHRVAT